LPDPFLISFRCFQEHADVTSDPGLSSFFLFASFCNIKNALKFTPSRAFPDPKTVYGNEPLYGPDETDPIQPSKNFIT
jgi:hypothetical protein